MNWDGFEPTPGQIAEGVARMLFWPVVGVVALFVALKVLT